MDLPVYAITAAAAFGLVSVRRENNRLARGEYQLSVRPLLAEMPQRNDQAREMVRFGAPRHNSVQLPSSWVYLDEDGTLLQVSVPFRNVGAGAAVITHVATEPRGMGSVIASKNIVAVGDQTRVNATLMLRPSSQREYLQVSEFTLNIEYTDADGYQAMISRAHVHRFSQGRSYVGPIEVLRRGESEPFLTASPIIESRTA